MWELFRALTGPLGSLCGAPIGGSLNRSWRALGSFWCALAALVAILAALGAPWGGVAKQAGVSEPVWVLSWATLGASLAALEGSWEHIGGSWEHLGGPWWHLDGILGPLGAILASS